MSNNFQEQLAKARREQILDAAIEVIAEQGFQRTKIKQIAARAGVADGTIYNYFKNKDAIFLAIMGRLSEAEVRELDFAEAQKIPFAQFVQGYIAHRAQEVGAAHQILKAVMPEAISNPELSKALYEQIYEPGFKVAEAYFAHLMENGRLPPGDPVIMARLFASPLIGLMFLRLMGDEHVIEHWETYGAEMGKLLLAAYGDNHADESSG
ncbi:MAG: TetR/AcrR family transcriptional regulator [Chloroflexota bacterium]